MRTSSAMPASDSAALSRSMARPGDPSLTRSTASSPPGSREMRSHRRSVCWRRFPSAEEEVFPVGQGPVGSGLDLEEGDAGVETGPLGHQQALLTGHLQRRQRGESRRRVGEDGRGVGGRAAVTLQHQAHEPDQGIDREAALHDVLVGTLADGLDGRQDVIRVGQHDDRDAGRERPDCPDGGGTGPVGEAEFGEDEIDRFPGEHRHGRPQRRCLADDEVRTDLLEDAGHQPGEQRVVFDEQHPDPAVGGGQGDVDLGRQVDHTTRRRLGPASTRAAPAPGWSPRPAGIGILGRHARMVGGAPDGGLPGF